MRLALVVSLVLVSSIAASEDRERITLTVGKTAVREVGWAMGSVCDDDTIVDAQMRNKDPDTNEIVLRGKRAGTTLCRAGTYNIENRPTFLFEITVVPGRR